MAHAARLTRHPGTTCATLPYAVVVYICVRDSLNRELSYECESSEKYDSTFCESRSSHIISRVETQARGVPSAQKNLSPRDVAVFAEGAKNEANNKRREPRPTRKIA